MFGIPTNCLRNGGIALVGWLAWAYYASRARYETRQIVEVFGVELKREPWPLWSVTPISLVLLSGIAYLLYLARERATQQKRHGAAVGRPRSRFLLAPATWLSLATWGLHAYTLYLAGCFLLWLLLSGVLFTVATTAQVPFAAAVMMGDRFAEAAATAEAAGGGPDVVLTGPAHGSLPGPGEPGHMVPALVAAASDWAKGAGSRGYAGGAFKGPDGACPEGCIDVSALGYFLGDSTCVCDPVGGVFATVPHAEAAAAALSRALWSLLLAWLGAWWLCRAAIRLLR